MKLRNTQENQRLILKARRQQRAAAAKSLVGKLIRYSVPLRDMKGRAHPPGEFRALVLSVTAGPRMGFRSCRVARPSNPDGSTLKQRYNGERVRVYPEWITGVKHRKVKSLAAFFGEE